MQVNVAEQHVEPPPPRECPGLNADSKDHRTRSYALERGHASIRTILDPHEASYWRSPRLWGQERSATPELRSQLFQRNELATSASLPLQATPQELPRCFALPEWL